MTKQLIPALTLYNGSIPGLDEDPADLSSSYAVNGADALIVLDLSDDDASHDRDVAAFEKICKASDIPVFAAGHMIRFEDVKKALYAGCSGVILNGSKERTEALLKEASDRFGKDRIFVSFSSADDVKALKECAENYASGIVLMTPIREEAKVLTSLPVIDLSGCSDERELADLLKNDGVTASAGGFLNEREKDLHAVKAFLSEEDIPVNIPVSNIAWSDFKTNAEGLIPVISQDDLTDEVLILAYMNEEAFLKTLKTGRMTYYSRSRQCLWTKGETSGHFQYVRSLKLDCDNDTMLARVIQIGPACHTGRKSCFYQDLYEKKGREKNARRVLDDVYKIIEDRKIHPKEGSYTNYLFDKGIDKILKKVGEENTEIIIAAKNPDASEIKYEISDYLYHLMVLMVERGVTWDEIAEELAKR